MKLLLSLLLILYSANISYSKEVVKLDPGENTYEKDGLTIKIIIIESWDQAMAVMKSRQGNVEQIIPSKKFGLGSMVVPFILFSTDGIKNDKAKITYNIKTIKPDGSLDFERVNQIVVDGTPPPELGMYKQSVGCQLAKDDQLGKYTFEISVYDHIKKVEVEFELNFNVVEKINTINITR